MDLKLIHHISQTNQSVALVKPLDFLLVSDIFDKKMLMPLTI